MVHREAQQRVPTLRDANLVEELPADADAVLGGGCDFGANTIRQLQRTDEAVHPGGVRLVSPALDKPRIEPVLAPAFREQVEGRCIVAGGLTPAHFLF